MKSSTGTKSAHSDSTGELELPTEASRAARPEERHGVYLIVQGHRWRKTKGQPPDVKP